VIKQILLVDDDDALRELLALGLSDEGFAVEPVSTGGAAWRSFQSAPPDLVILDVLLPEIDGLELCRRIRRTSLVPIILLTSRAEEVDRVTGLELGADDYVTKPFSTRELCARIRAIDRRLGHRPERQLEPSPAAAPQAVRAPTQSPLKDLPAPLQAGELVLDAARFEVRWRGHKVDLTRSEFQLLSALVQRRGFVLSRERLLDLARGDDAVITDRTVDTFIKRIRKKLREADEAFDHIETVFGIGYRYRA
jgi:two-component system response regulator ChvI